MMPKGLLIAVVLLAVVGGAAVWVYKARRERAEGLWLELEITEVPCTDSMSGEAFPYTAAVTFEDRHMDGCAS